MNCAASATLGRFDIRSIVGSMHMWLTLPERYSGGEFVTTAERRGVLLRASELFATDDQPSPNAVRVSLSTPKVLSDVLRGLEVLQTILVAK